MRTTVTLEAEVARLVQAAMHRERKGFKQVINEAIRRGLSPAQARESRAAYRVKAHRARLAPGVDRAAFNRAADRQEEDALLARRPGRR